MLNPELIRNALFPVSSAQYWFITNYILLYLSLPWINIFLNFVNKEIHFSVIIFGFVVLSVIPTILRVDLIFSYYILYMVCLALFCGSILEKEHNTKT